MEIIIKHVVFQLEGWYQGHNVELIHAKMDCIHKVHESRCCHISSKNCYIDRSPTSYPLDGVKREQKTKKLWYYPSTREGLICILVKKGAFDSNKPSWVKGSGACSQIKGWALDSIVCTCCFQMADVINFRWLPHIIVVVIVTIYGC